MESMPAAFKERMTRLGSGDLGDVRGQVTALRYIPVDEVAKSIRYLTNEREYESAIWLGQLNFQRCKSDAAFLSAYRSALAKVGAMSDAFQLSTELVLIKKASAGGVRNSLGRLVEVSGWIPQIFGRKVDITPGGPDRIFHLVKESRPYLSNGFVARSHENFKAELATGLQPFVVTEPGFGRSQGGKTFNPSQIVDGVKHFHLDLGDLDYGALPVDTYLQLFADLAFEKIKLVRPAVIHASSGRRGFETALVALALKRHTGLPMIYEVRSFFEGNWTGEFDREATGEAFQSRMAVEAMCMQEADLVLTIGDSMKEEIVERGIASEKIDIIPNGVDTERFTPGPKNADLIAAHSLQDTFIFGYISNMDHYRESQETLVDALAAVRHRGVNATLVLVGGGARAEIVKSRAQELGVESYIRFVGQVDHSDIVDYYRLMDLFVVPRIPERAGKYVTPLKPFEAIACGIPIAVSDLPALQEIADSPNRGLSFPPGDASAIAEIICDAVLNQEKFKDMAQTARDWVLANRAWIMNGSRYQRAIGRLAQKGGIQDDS